MFLAKIYWKYLKQPVYVSIPFSEILISLRERKGKAGDVHRRFGSLRQSDKELLKWCCRNSVVVMYPYRCHQITKLPKQKKKLYLWHAYWNNPSRKKNRKTCLCCLWSWPEKQKLGKNPRVVSYLKVVTKIYSNWYS